MEIDPIVNLIPHDEFVRIMSQDECELELDFMGFTDLYKSLSEIIPKAATVIDFGCYLAAQSYYFAEHKKYIGVDIVTLDRFTPPNATHYVGSIQRYIAEEVPKLLDGKDPLSYCAICSYVPDSNATKIVRETFPNVFCYYPTRNY